MMRRSVTALREKTVLRYQVFPEYLEYPDTTLKKVSAKVRRTSDSDIHSRVHGTYIRTDMRSPTVQGRLVLGRR